MKSNKQDELEKFELVDSDLNGIPDQININIKWLFGRIVAFVTCAITLIITLITGITGL